MRNLSLVLSAEECFEKGISDVQVFDWATSENRSHNELHKMQPTTTPYEHVTQTS